MSNVSLGTIYAWNIAIPKYVQLIDTIDKSPNDLLQLLKSNQLFGQFLRAEEISPSALVELQNSVLKELTKVAQGEDFYELIFWLENNMTKVRKLFRKSISSGTALEQILDDLDKILGQSSELRQELMDTYSKALQKEFSSFEIEQALDRLVLKNLQEKAKGNKIQEQYIELLTENLENSTKMRTNKMKDTQAETIEELDFIKTAEAEVKFANKAIYEYNDDLAILQYFIRLKYLFYNLQLLVMGTATKEELIDYDKF